MVHSTSTGSSLLRWTVSLILILLIFSCVGEGEAGASKACRFAITDIVCYMVAIVGNLESWIKLMWAQTTKSWRPFLKTLVNGHGYSYPLPKFRWYSLNYCVFLVTPYEFLSTNILRKWSHKRLHHIYFREPLLNKNIMNEENSEYMLISAKQVSYVSRERGHSVGNGRVQLFRSIRSKVHPLSLANSSSKFFEVLFLIWRIPQLLPSSWCDVAAEQIPWSYCQHCAHKKRNMARLVKAETLQ